MGHDGADGIPSPHYPTGSESVQESVVRTPNGGTDWFKIERGVSQGCAIFILNTSCGVYRRNITTESKSEEEERPICGLHTTQPCSAQIRKRNVFVQMEVVGGFSEHIGEEVVFLHAQLQRGVVRIRSCQLFYK